MAFPQLIEEDFRQISGAIDDLLAKSDASGAMLVEKAGHLIVKAGDIEQFNPDIFCTLASNSFNAVQFMVGMLNETSFQGIYQQGETYSTLMLNVDEDCLVVIVFKSSLAVGAVKYYASDTIKTIASLLKTAGQRDPTVRFDLTDLNVTDAGALFGRKDPSQVTGDKSGILKSSAMNLAASSSLDIVEEIPAEEPAPEYAPAADLEPVAEEPSAPVEESPAEPAPVAAPAPAFLQELLQGVRVVARKGPIVEVAGPGTFYWCACGRSKSQPFCDGSHEGTGIDPVEIKLRSSSRVPWCGCKHTKNAPFCDGSHKEVKG
jgi:CDGSH-type Zn-finger protein/predicted regulator of Ras-like GTPase activity (Roadblock/LC7/MglB family)